MSDFMFLAWSLFFIKQYVWQFKIKNKKRFNLEFY